MSLESLIKELIVSLARASVLVTASILFQPNSFPTNLYETDLVVPTFDTKVTEYLCSGWVFFSSDKFRLFN